MDNELRNGASKEPATRASASSGQKSAASGSLSDTVSKSAEDLKGQASQALDDVKSKARQLREGASDTYRKATESTRDGYDRATNWASDRYENATRSAKQVHRRSVTELDRIRGNAEELVTHNPVMIGVAGLAAGLLIGALLPRTQRENEAFGKLSDDLREKGTRYAADLVRQGKDRVVEALDATAAQGRDHP